MDMRLPLGPFGYFFSVYIPVIVSLNVVLRRNWTASVCDGERAAVRHLRGELGAALLLQLRQDGALVVLRAGLLHQQPP